MDDSKPEVVHIRTQKVWLDPTHRIIMAEFDDNAELDLEDAKASTKAMIKVSNGEPRPLIVDFTNLKSQTKACREYYSKDEAHIKTYTAVGILVSSPLSRVIANFFLGLNKPVRPTKLFDSKEQAIDWLKQFG